MKALLKKECFLLQNQVLTLLAVCIPFSILLAFMGMLQMLPSVLAGVGISIYVNGYSYDEMSHFDRYVLCTPLGLKNFVLSKYIVGIVVVFIGSLLGFGVSVGIAGFTNQAVNWDFLIGNGAGGFFGVWMIVLVVIPVISKSGITKMYVAVLLGLVFMVAIAALMAVLGELLSLFIGEGSADLLTFGIAVVLMFLSSYVSYRVTLKIVATK